MPDATLLALADAGRLSQPKILEAQVLRMLADPKARALSEQFVGQWLGIRTLGSVAAPDPRKFPEFTPALREAMVSEPTEFFAGLLREDRSLLELLDSDYAWVNADLARHYGIPGVSGQSFTRVSLPDRRRGGVTGMAAVLTQTSYPQRTSPVLRGKWLLEEVFGTPPPPPPPLVATLSPNDAKSEGLTFRQRLEKHRKDPNCAACHARLDPWASPWRISTPSADGAPRCREKRSMPAGSCRVVWSLWAPRPSRNSFWSAGNSSCVT